MDITWEEVILCKEAKRSREARPAGETQQHEHSVRKTTGSMWRGRCAAGESWEPPKPAAHMGAIVGMGVDLLLCLVLLCPTSPETLSDSAPS